MEINSQKRMEKMKVKSRRIKDLKINAERKKKNDHKVEMED